MDVVSNLDSASGKLEGQLKKYMWFHVHDTFTNKYYAHQSIASTTCIIMGCTCRKCCLVPKLEHFLCENGIGYVVVAHSNDS